MTCNRFRTLIQQRFDQDLTTQDHRALINHLEGCESCSKFDHQLDQMIQAAQDTPAPDEVRPQNPEALARLIMEQLPQKKSSLVTMILGVFGGGGSKPKAAKAAKAEKPTSIKGGGAIKEKASKFKGKDKVGDRDAEQDRRPGGVTFGRKKDEHIDNEAIESQVGTFSRLKSISNRTPEQLDREAQSTTRSLGEKFGMPGANTVLDEGPLTLAESIKRKVSESQKLSPLDDDPDASGSLVPIPDSSGMGASPYARAEAASGGESSWGPPSFASSGAKPGQIGMTPEAEKVDWGGGAQMAKAPAMPAFNPSTPVGFDEHPGSSIGLAPPGSKRPMTTEQPAESPKVGIGLAPSAGAGWGGSSSSSASTAGGGGGWGATDTSQASADGSNSWGGASTPAAPAASAAPAQAAPASGWTSGWGGEGAASAQVPLKSSDSWAVPGSESTNSWGQPAESQAVAEPASAPPAAQAPAADPWAPPSGSWGGGSTESGGNQAAAAQVPSSNDAWGAAVSGGATGASDPWGTPAAPTASKEANAPAAQPAASSNDAWGAAVNSPQPAAASSDPWGAAAAAPAAAESSFAPAPAATASGDAWGQPAAAPAAPSGDAWGQPAAAPAPSGDAWGNAPAAEPAPAPAASDAWGTPAAEPAPAPAAQSAWGTHPEPAQSNSAWGAQPAAEPAAAWGSQPEAAPAQPAAADGWGAAASQPAWGAAPAQPAATTTGESATQNADQGGGQWGQPAAPVADTTSMASGYSTIPPGQFATPAAAGSAIASSGWGQAAVPPALDNSQIEAKKNAWAAEAEQLETGTWKAFAPKMNEGLGGKATSMPAAGPSPMGGAAAAPAGERWDVPIQERMKTQADQAAPTQAPGQPVAPVISPIQPMQPGQAAPAAARWDVPIQERPKTEGDMAAPPAVPMQPQIGMPPGAAGSPVMSSGIPVNQIVEKMGQVLGGNAEESRWDVPIQERIKSGQSSQEMPAVAAAEVQQAPVPAASSWGQPAFEAPQAPAMAAAPAPAQAADSASSWGTSSSSWGQEPAAAAPAASGWDSQPAAAPVASGWDSQPAAQTASGWNQPATSSWGDAPANNAISQQNPIVSQNQAPVGAAAWGNGADTAGSSGASSWGQPAAPAASSWASAPQQAAPPPPPPPPPPPQPPAVRPEITDKVAGGGLLSGIDDRAIDRIFGEIGVQESVSKTVVNSGGEPVSNFSPSTPAPQPMAAPEPAPFQAPPPAPAPAAFAQPEAPKGLLGGIDDNAIDRIFSQNLGVSEPSVPVGNAGMAAPASGGWAQPPVAPAPAPAPTAAETAQSSGWGAPASSGWGQPPAMTAPPAPEPAPSPNTGWGTPAASSSQWGQPPAAPAPVPAAAAAAPAIGDNGQPKLFSVDDSVMDRIFSDNLGIPSDNQPAANAQTMGAPAAPAAAPVRQTMPEMVAPAAPYTPGPPPKIEGIGRLDAGADPNQDAGSGRIASIGKFLLDQKDLDKIGKLTNTDNNEGKLRILTKENSDDLQALLGQIGTQKGVIGSVIVGHDGLLIANTMPSDMDAESVGVWALGVYMNTEHVTRKMGHERVHQVVSRTPRGYVIIADFGGGLLVTVTEGKDTDSLIPLMRTITQLVN